MLPFAGRLSPSILSGRITESIGKPRKIRTMDIIRSRPIGGAIVVRGDFEMTSDARIVVSVSSL